MPVAGGLPPPSPARQAAPDDELVQRARREIAEIVREVATLARQPIDRDPFFAALVDRTVCAIAAEGAVVWDLQGNEPVIVVKTGRVTDTSIDPAAVATHVCLLREVRKLQTPVVVPSTPAARDPNLPSNPLPFPVAVVPILDLAEVDAVRDDSKSRYLLEVFLEHEAGVATQRGYLRFVTQMGDLASEFLRTDEIRQSRRRHALQTRLLAALDRLHRLETAAAVAAELVDATAEMFAAARVSLAKIAAGRAKLLAVSHVDSIDHRGHASRGLCQEIGALAFATDQRMTTDWTAATNTGITEQTDVRLFPWVATRDVADRWRLFLQSNEQRGVNELTNSALLDWSQQSLAILATRMQFESFPLAKAYLAIAPQILSVSPSRGRRLATTIGALLVLALIAMIPTPMAVTMPATLRPAGTRIHYAPSDAVVESVEVKHAQLVSPGDVLVRLRDWSIEEQLTTLVARRAVLQQRLARSISSLVESPGSSTYPRADRSLSSDEELVQQQRLLDEEIVGVDQQIGLVEAARNRLTIRSDRGGRVDAWQTELTATGRPVRRGDSLIRVEPVSATWMADARIDQSRIGVVLERFEQDAEAVVKVSTIARPDQPFTAKYSRREMILDTANEGSRIATSVGQGTLAIELAIVSPSGDGEPSDWTYGAPALVTIDCGIRPLVQVVFFDLERAIRRAWARWI